MAMFGDTLDDTEKNSTFKKTVYLALTQGEHTVRILDAVETKKYIHNFGKGRSNIACLGSECPICENNKKILYEHPEDYKEVEGWNPRRQRFFLNVLDRKDGQIKVLSCGPTLIEDIKVMSKGVRTAQDETIDIRGYDWALFVKGEGLNKETRPMPRYMGQVTNVDYNPLELYDLSDCVISLTASEMLDVASGASLKDIFAVRKASKEAQKVQPLHDDVLMSDVMASVDEIFKG